MSAKIKGLVALLVLAMGLSVWYWRSVLSTDQLLEEQRASLLKNGLTDSDADGLSAREESYWRSDPDDSDTDGDGFLDGEEVMSGHNPIVPGPRDYLDAGQNISERTTALIWGAQLAGDLDPSSSSYVESVQMIAEAMTDQYQRNSAIVLDPLVLAAEDTLETRAAYIGQMSRIFSTVVLPAQEDVTGLLETVRDIPLSNVASLTSDAKRYAAFVTKVRALSATMGERAQKVADTPVPESFVQSHKQLIRTLRIAQKQLELSSRLNEDPLQGTVALRSLVYIADRAFGDYLSLFNDTMLRNLNP